MFEDKDLKPCPFQHPKGLQFDGFGIHTPRLKCRLSEESPHVVICTCGARGPNADTEQSAVIWWNTRAGVRRLRTELALAVAHDRQPYPTADAYEKVCDALNKSRERERVLVETLEKVDEIEQLHRGRSFGEIVQAWHDVRKCGDLARAVLEAVKE